MPFFVLSTTVGKAAPRPCRRALSRHVGGGCMRHNGAHPLASQPSAMPQTDSTAAASPLLRALYHRAHAAGPGLGAVALHLGAERTVVAAGPDAGEPAMVLTLALGHDKTARDFFRGAVPTPLELETAIAAVEDEVHAAHRRYRACMPEGPAATPLAADPGLHEVATLAGMAPGPWRVLPLDAVERLFNRLAAVSEGRPAAHEGLPQSPAFAARLLVLRELMHHMPFAAIVLVPQADLPGLG